MLSLAPLPAPAARPIFLARSQFPSPVSGQPCSHPASPRCDAPNLPTKIIPTKID